MLRAQRGKVALVPGRHSRRRHFRDEEEQENEDGDEALNDHEGQAARSAEQITSACSAQDLKWRTQTGRRPPYSLGTSVPGKKSSLWPLLSSSSEADAARLTTCACRLRRRLLELSPSRVSLLAWAAAAEEMLRCWALSGWTKVDAVVGAAVEEESLVRVVLLVAGSVAVATDREWEDMSKEVERVLVGSMMDEPSPPDVVDGDAPPPLLPDLFS